MAIGTPFHARTAALNKALNWREWSGYFAAGRYHDFHQPEYAAIRNAVALIDVSPLCKYRVSGPGAATLIDRVCTRDVSKQKIGQVIYTPWCDPQGKILQEGTVMRFAENDFQVNAAEPCQRWMQRCGSGLDVQIEDRSAALAALAVQGPLARQLLAEVAGAGVAELPFFRHRTCRIAGVEVDISRTGYTGDLGYELWLPAADALPVWDRLMDVGRAYGAMPCGLMALDVARLEAGFILIGVDYIRADRALIPNQLSSPYELGLGWAVKLGKKNPCISQQALKREKSAGSAWALVGLEIEWDPLEALYDAAGLMPDLPLSAWREAIPVYTRDGHRQVGRATSGCWSSRLKKYIAIASLEAPQAQIDSYVGMEITVDHSRKQAPAKIVELPFFRPDRMRR